MPDETAPPIRKVYAPRSTGFDIRSPLTTGQIANVCKVAPRTVSKWCDSGRMKGYRIPGSLDRRVLPADVLEFLRTHHMPVPPALLECCEPDPPVLAMFGVGAEGTAELATGFTHFADPFEFGYFVATTKIGRAVLGDEYGLVVLAQAVRMIRARQPEAAIVLVVSGDITVDLLESAGLQGENRVSRPFDLQLLEAA